MNKLLRLVTLFGICLMLVFVSINNIQADDPAPVGTPAEGNDTLSSSIDAAPEGAPAEGNDTLSSSIDAAPEGAPAEGNDALPGSVDAAPEGAPAEGNDALSSDIAEPLGECASSELETTIELSVGVPHGEPAVNP